MRSEPEATDVGEFLETVRVKLDRRLYEEAWHDLQSVPEHARDQWLVLAYSFWAANWLEYTEPAKKLALKLMKLEPADGHWQMCYGDLLMTTHGPEAAMPWYRKALRLSPDNQSVCIAMVDCLLALGRVEEARQFLLETIERFPKQLYYASTRPEHARLLAEAGEERVSGFASPKECRNCNAAVQGRVGTGH